MDIRKFLLISINCLLLGCSQFMPIKQQIDPNDPDKMLAYLMEGFSTAYPNLYCDESMDSRECRLRKLIDAMGYQDFYCLWPDRGNGNELWYSNQPSDRELTYSEVLVLSATKPPHVKKLYHNTIYNDFGQEIATTYKDQNKSEHLKFNNGSDFLVERPYLLDTTGQYLCKGGRRYCSLDKVSNEAVLVYAANCLERPIYVSNLAKSPHEMIYFNDGLFLISSSDTDPSGLEVEFAQQQENKKWVIKEHYFIKPPWLYALHFLDLESFDPVTRNMIIYAKLDWPFPGKMYFYDYNQRKLLRKSFLNSPVVMFFNPEILSNNVKYIERMEK